MTERSGAVTLPVRLTRTRGWLGSAVNQRILAAMFTVGAATLVTKLVAMAKDVVVARHFGTGDGVDAFLIAAVLPDFAVNVVAGALPSALVPIYMRVRARDGAGEARRLLSTVFAVEIGLLLAATLVLALTAPLVLPLLGASFGGAKLALTERLFLVLLPTLVVGGAASTFSAALNADERFLLPSIAPLLVSAAMILGVLGGAGRWGIGALAGGMVLGGLTSALVQGWGLARRGLLALPRWRERHPEARTVFREMAPLVAGALVMSSTLMVDQSMAAMLGPGSVARFSYGTKIVAAAMTVAVTAVSTVIFPHFSRMVAAGRWTEVRRTLRSYSALILLATVPATLALVWLSEPVVALLFQRGRFSAADTRAVAHVQSLFALQIPFYVLGMVAVRLLSAMGKNRVLLWVSVMNFATNILGNLLFMRFFGVSGIALSTTLVYLVSCTVMFVVVLRRLDVLRDGEPPATAVAPDASPAA